VIGSRGQLGAAVVHEFAGPYEVIALTRGELDVTDDGAVRQVIGRIAPDVIVNCAGFNDVDGSVDRPVEALNANAFAVRALARAAADRGATLVHYSTDFVFDGTKEAPYTEEDRPNPLSVYAISKLLGEWFAADTPRAFVLRVESLFGQAPGAGRPKGSVAVLLNAMLAAQEVRAFADRTVSPTYVLDAARATRELLERGAPPGLYHTVNSGQCTWLDLARELADRLKIDAKLQPIRCDDLKLKAFRPRYCAMSNAKLASIGVAMPTWRDALARYLQASQTDRAALVDSPRESLPS
jgi:dTDP-4-dehydrorhamnose reductase